MYDVYIHWLSHTIPVQWNACISDTYLGKSGYLSILCSGVYVVSPCMLMVNFFSSIAPHIPSSAMILLVVWSAKGDVVVLLLPVQVLRSIY